MGVVELVNDQDMHRNIAIKRLTHGTQPDLVRRFVAEIRTVAQLEHPNIVPVHDVGLDANGGFFFIMKHVKGDTLEGLIARLQSGNAAAHERWTFNARARLFLGVLNAVAYAHERGVLHRDLKPANIMVGEYGEVTVMDWGIACAIPPVKAGSAPPIDPTLLPREPDTHHVGTPLYMSPEQARKENSALDQRSDVYSLGAVLYELLFLEHYLPAGQPLDAVLAGVQQVTPATQKHEVEKGQASVPAELGWFISRAMAKNPADRYQTVHEMRDELERVLAGKFRVQCQRTAFKRALYELMAFSERYPKTSIIGSTVLVSLLVMGAVQSLLRVL
jgi:serine/threonine-protein kinase